MTNLSNKKGITTLDVINIVLLIIFVVSVIVSIIQNFFLKDVTQAIKNTTFLFAIISSIGSIVFLTFSYRYSIKSLENTINDFNEFKNGFIQDLKKEKEEFIEKIYLDIITVISPISVTSDLLKKNYVKSYVNDIFISFNNKIRYLSLGEIVENNPDEYHKFAMQTFNFAKQNGTIIASSLVEPNSFWGDPVIKGYLENNRKLIHEKNVTFKRFFLVDGKEDKANVINAVIKNIEIGADVFIIDINKIRNKDIIFDGGIVDNSICIESILDETDRRIKRVIAYVQEYEEKFKKIKNATEKWTTPGVGVSPTEYFKAEPLFTKEMARLKETESLKQQIKEEAKKSLITKEINNEKDKSGNKKKFKSLFGFRKE